MERMHCFTVTNMTQIMSEHQLFPMSLSPYREYMSNFLHKCNKIFHRLVDVENDLVREANKSKNDLFTGWSKSSIFWRWVVQVSTRIQISQFAFKSYVLRHSNLLFQWYCLIFLTKIYFKKLISTSILSLLVQNYIISLFHNLQILLQSLVAVEQFKWKDTVIVERISSADSFHPWNLNHFILN